MFRRTWKIEWTLDQWKRGLVFFLLYLSVFPWLSVWLQRLLFGDREPPASQVSLIYYAILFLLVLIAFWGLLEQDLFDLWAWMPENLMGLIVGLCVAAALYLLLSRLPFPVPDPMAAQYAQEFQLTPIPTLVLILLLIPLVEEVFFRGFLYGNLRNSSRPLAVVIVTLAYTLSLVWRYAWEAGDPRYFSMALLYLPISAVLTLAYESGGSVWFTTLLHGGINGFILWMAL